MDFVINVERLFVLLTGLVWGSFLNVCIYRLPRDKSVISPGSTCPACAKAIAWYDNIPIISFLLLKGKCRNCRQSISGRYPLVELLGGLMFLILFNHFGPSGMFLKSAFFFSLLIVVSFIDIDFRAIPAYLCLLGIIAAICADSVVTLRLVRQGYFDPGALPLIVTLRNLVLGFGVGYAFKFFGDFFIAFYLGLRRKDSIEGETESLGLGDVDFLGLVAVYLGATKAVLVFFVAPFIAAGYAIFAFIFKKSHLIPYLPYLSAATLIVFFWGDAIWKLVFHI